MFAIIGLILFILWILAIVDLIASDGGCGYKLAWLIVVTVLPVIGTILYFLFRNRS